MRMALDLLRRDAPAVQRFAEAVRKLREEVRYRQDCCNISDQPASGICDKARDRGPICVVEDIRAT